MAKIYIRKQGQVCTYYLDQFGQSIPFSNPDEPPETWSTIQTISYPEAQQLFKLHDVVYLENKPNNERVGPDPTRLSASQMRGMLEGMGKSKEEIDKLLEGSQHVVVPIVESGQILSQSQQAAQAADLEEIEMKEKIKQEFRMLLVKYEASKSPEAKAEAQAVANFILTIAPEMQEELVALKEAASKPRFTL